MTAPTLVQYNNYVSEKLTTRTPKVSFNTTQTNQDYVGFRTGVRRILPSYSTDAKFGNQIIEDFPGNWGRGQMNNITRRAAMMYYLTTPGLKKYGPRPGFIYDAGGYMDTGGLRKNTVGGWVMYSDEYRPVREYMTANEGNYTNIDAINKNYGGPGSVIYTQGDRIRGLKALAAVRSYRASKR